MSPLSSHNRYPPYPEPQPLPHFDGPAFSCFFVLTAAPEHVTATSEVQRWQSATAATSGPLESVCLLHVGRQPDVQQNAVSNPKSKLKTVVQTHVFPYFSKKSAHMCNVKWCVPCWLDDFKQNVFQNSKRSNPPGNYGQILKSTIVPPKGERPFSICMTHVWTKQSTDHADSHADSPYSNHKLWAKPPMGPIMVRNLPSVAGKIQSSLQILQQVTPHGTNVYCRYCIYADFDIAFLIWRFTDSQKGTWPYKQTDSDIPTQKNTNVQTHRQPVPRRAGVRKFQKESAYKPEHKNCQ